jgi:hypothetical protein
LAIARSAGDCLYLLIVSVGVAVGLERTVMVDACREKNGKFVKGELLVSVCVFGLVLRTVVELSLLYDSPVVFVVCLDLSWFVFV